MCLAPHKFIYDLWRDTVNTGRGHVSAATSAGPGRGVPLRAARCARDQRQRLDANLFHLSTIAKRSSQRVLQIGRVRRSADRSNVRCVSNSLAPTLPDERPESAQPCRPLNPVRVTAFLPKAAFQNAATARPIVNSPRRTRNALSATSVANGHRILCNLVPARHSDWLRWVCHLVSAAPPAVW
jgi:hypothetical protein